MVNLVDKQVMHETFGKGNVVNCDKSYIKVHFQSGNKKFVFPDAFKSYLTLLDQDAARLVKGKIEEKDKRTRELELKLQRKMEQRKKERREILRREQAALDERRRARRDNEVLLRSQSVFWIKPQEEEFVFKDWNVFVGLVNSGQRKGQPRRLARINQNSACLLTARNTNDKEKGRRIIGAFMVERGFSSRRSSDGYIPAHPEHRIHLSDAESEKILFWNYYKNSNHPENIVWRSGRHRYFDNIWMAQILQDIVDLRKGGEEEEKAKDFLKYFCQMNNIDIENIPAAGGALVERDTLPNDSDE